MKTGDRKQIGNVVFEVTDSGLIAYHANDQRTHPMRREFRISYHDKAFWIDGTDEQSSFTSLDFVASHIGPDLAAEVEAFDGLSDFEEEDEDDSEDYE